MTEENPYENIETLRAYIKEQMIEWLDKKFNEPPKFSYFFKNFPDNQKLNFGFKMGSIISIIMTDAIKDGVKEDMVHTAIHEAMGDLHDILLLKYQKIG